MDRGQLPKMVAKAKEALGFETIEAIAAAGYYRGADLIACCDIGVPRTNTSNAKAEGRFGRDFFASFCKVDDRRPQRSRIAGAATNILARCGGKGGLP